MTDSTTPRILDDVELAAHRRLLARRQLPVGRARSTCSTTRCCASRCGSSTSSRGCSATGARRPGLNFIYAHLNRVITRARPRRDLRDRPRARRARARGQHLPRGHLQRGLPAHRPRRGGAAAAVPAVLVPGRHPEPRRARDARLDPRGRRARLRARARLRRRVRQPRPARRAASSATARRRPARWPPSWHSNKFLDPVARRRGAADPAPQRLQDRQPDRARADPATTSCDALLEGYGYEPLLRRGRRPGGDAPADGRDARRGRSTRSPRSSAAARGGATGAAAVADDRAAHAEGLDRARRRSTACRSRAPGAPTRCRCRGSRTTRSTSPSSRSGCAATGRGAVRRRRRACVRELAALAPRGRPAHGRQPARQRRPAAARPASCPTSATTPSTVAEPGARRGRGDPGARQRSCATSCAPTPTTATSGSSGPDETASNRLGAVFEVTDRAWEAEIAPTDDHLAPRRPGDGGAQRAPVPGLARGLPAHRPARPVQLLRGVHPHRRLDVQPARQVAEGDARDPVAAADRVAELPAHLARLAPGPQRLLATRTRASSTTSSTRRPRSSASTCRRTPTACCRSPTTACAAATTSTSSSPASSRRCSG